MNLTWIAVVCAVALLAPAARGEIVQGAEWHPFTLSTSPKKNYSLQFLKVKDSDLKPRTEEDPRPGPGDAISLYLVRKHPSKVVTEIDPNFRCYRSQTSRFAPYWSRDGSSIAVVFNYHVNSGLALLRKTASGWHKLTLPDFDWDKEFRTIAKVHHTEPEPMKGFIDRVSLKKDRVSVRYFTTFNGNPDSLTASFVVSYRPSRQGWLMQVDSTKAEKD
jgi:hypothetical protein